MSERDGGAASPKVRRRRILRSFILIVVAWVAVLMGFCAWRIFLGARPEERDYHRELIDLSRSIVPDTPEARANAERVDRAIELYRMILQEEFDALPFESQRTIGSATMPWARNLRGKFPFLPIDYRSEEEQEFILEYTRHIYDRYASEVGPLFDGMTAESPVVAYRDLPANELLFSSHRLGMTDLRNIAQWEIHRLLEAMDSGDSEMVASAMNRLAAMIASFGARVTLAESLIQTSIEALLLRTIHGEVVDSVHDHTVLRRVHEIMNRIFHDPLGVEVVFEGERLLPLSFIRALYSSDREQYASPELDSFPRPWMLRIMITEQAFHDVFNDMFDRIIAVVRGSEHDSFDQILRDARKQGLPGGRAEMLLPAFSGAAEVRRIHEVHVRTVLTVLALEAYRADHSRYPAALPELVPRYLREIPTDPFSLEGDSLRYRPESSGDGCLLWSIGPDGVDNSGSLDGGELVRIGLNPDMLDALELLAQGMRGRSWRGDIPLNVSYVPVREALRAVSEGR